MKIKTLAAGFLVVVAACSLQNREGPDVTCADLNDGAFNACEQGIIATCSGGAVMWRVCEDDPDVCDAPWQVTGDYSCEPPFVEGSGGSGGSGGNGGSLGAETCGFKYKEATCSSCVQTNCCAESQNCANNEHCTDCVTRPGNTTPCVPDDNLNPYYGTFVDCLSMSCSGSC